MAEKSIQVSIRNYEMMASGFPDYPYGNNDTKTKQSPQVPTIPQVPTFPQFLYVGKDTAQYFNSKQPGQKAYKIQQCIDDIIASFKDISKYGIFLENQIYDFSTDKYGLKIKANPLRRKVYVRFECPKCTQQCTQQNTDNKSMHKRWTSILGNFQIYFWVLKLQQYMLKVHKQNRRTCKKYKNKHIILWNAKMYKQQCQECLNWAQSSVYQSQLDGCNLSLWILIHQKINKIKHEYHKGNRNKVVQVHNHKQEHCQACKMKVCFNRPKTEAQKQEQESKSKKQEPKPQEDKKQI